MSQTFSSNELQIFHKNKLMSVKFYIATNLEPLTKYGVLAVCLQSRTCIKDACYDNPKPPEQIFIV